MLKTPILFMIFNRPEYTRKTFASIRKSKPKQLFIASDGPRDNKGKGKEKEIVNKLRKEVLNSIDWDCEVTTLFRDKNLGCKKAIAGAITWFFKNVEQGIILEDDCVPAQGFYTFCEQMLDKYKDDKRISMISGTNYLFNQEDSSKQDYFFSKYYSIWGWATWKRSWDTYDINMTDWSKHKQNKDLDWIFVDKNISSTYAKFFDEAYMIDTWDTAWVYSCIFQNTLAIAPVNNLISNIGCDGVRKTKQGESPYIQMPTSNKSYKNIKHPKGVYPDGLLDKIQFSNIDFFDKEKWAKTVRRWLIQVRFKKHSKIVKIFGIYLLKKGRI